MTDLSGLVGLPALDWREVFHMGIRVADLEAAQQELTKAIGVRWTQPAQIPMKAWAPGQGYRTYDLTISFTVEGPVHIELLYGSPGSYHDVRDGGAGLHHIGVWVDDVTRVNQFERYDHLVLIGRVEEVGQGEEMPFVYFRRKFHALPVTNGKPARAELPVVIELDLGWM